MAAETAKENLMRLGEETEALAREIHLNINARLIDAESAEINWAHCGTMGYVREQLRQIAGALGLREVA